MGYNQSIAENKGEILNLVDIVKKIGNKTIIRNISLSIPRNSTYAIIGPNGAGKTTLLRLVLDLFKYDSGSIEYYFDKGKIAALLENDYLFEKKTGSENIACFCDYLNIDRKTVIEKVERYAEPLKLDKYLNDKVAEYSKGMKRKLSILITILKDAELVIFDEPTSGLDPQSRVEIRYLFEILKKEGKTILLTSHDLAEIGKVSDTISILNGGQIVDTFRNDGTVDVEQKFFTALGGGVYE